MAIPTFFSKYLRELGYDARTEQTQYEGEAAEMDSAIKLDDEIIDAEA